MDFNTRVKRTPRPDNEAQTTRPRTKVVPRQMPQRNSDEENEATMADNSPPPMTRKIKTLTPHKEVREAAVTPKNGPLPGRKERVPRKEEVNEDCESDEAEVPVLLTPFGSIFRLPVEQEQVEAPKKKRRPRKKKNTERLAREPESDDDAPEALDRPPRSAAGRRDERSVSPPPRPSAGRRDDRSVSPPPRPTAGRREERSVSPPPRPAAGRREERSVSPPPRPSAGRRDERSVSPPPRPSASRREERSVSPPPRPSAGRRDERSASPPPRPSAGRRDDRSVSPPPRPAAVPDHRQPTKGRPHDRSQDVARHSEPPRSTGHRADQPRHEPSRKPFQVEYKDDHKERGSQYARGAPRSEPRYRDDRSDRHPTGTRGYEPPQREYRTEPRPVSHYDDHRGHGYDNRGRYEHDHPSPSRYNDAYYHRDHQQDRQPAPRVSRPLPDHGYSGRSHYYDDHRQPAPYDPRPSRGRPDERNEYRRDFYPPPPAAADRPYYPPARGYRDEYEYEDEYPPAVTAALSPQALALQQAIDDEKTRILLEMLAFDEEQAKRSQEEANRLSSLPYDD